MIDLKKVSNFHQHKLNQFVYCSTTKNISAFKTFNTLIFVFSYFFEVKRFYLDNLKCHTLLSGLIKILVGSIKI